jgi:hypothetical protein
VGKYTPLHEPSAVQSTGNDLDNHLGVTVCTRSVMGLVTGRTLAIRGVGLLDRGTLTQELVRTKINTWVSDHFGITVGIKVL